MDDLRECLGACARRIVKQIENANDNLAGDAARAGRLRNVGAVPLYRRAHGLFRGARGPAGASAQRRARAARAEDAESGHRCDRRDDQDEEQIRVIAHRSTSATTHSTAPGRIC